MSRNSHRPKIQWTIEEFLIFIYLSIADADKDVSSEELALVTSKLKTLLTTHFPTASTDIDFWIGTLQKTLEIKSEEDKKTILLDLCEKFQLNEAVKKHIVLDLQELINSDDLATLGEFEMIGFIRKRFAPKKNI